MLEIAEADSQGTLARLTRALASPNHVAIDFGCGTGSSTRLIAPHFGRVIGVDFSAGLIARAKRIGPPNIEYRCRDLAGKLRLSPRADAGFAMNLMIHPDAALRERVFRTMLRNIHPGGTLVIVVPALESALHVYRVLEEAAVQSGTRRRTATARTETLMKEEIVSLADGLLSVGGQATKHYTQSELNILAQCHRMTVRSISRVSYPWREETDAPEQLARFPLPWDWVMTAEKGGSQASRSLILHS